MRLQQPARNSSEKLKHSEWQLRAFAISSLVMRSTRLPYYLVRGFDSKTDQLMDANLKRALVVK